MAAGPDFRAKAGPDETVEVAVVQDWFLVKQQVVEAGERDADEDEGEVWPIEGGIDGEERRVMLLERVVGKSDGLKPVVAAEHAFVSRPASA